MSEKMPDEIVKDALIIAAGYAALVAKGVGNMPILKDRAKLDCEIIGKAIESLDKADLAQPAPASDAVQRAVNTMPSEIADGCEVYDWFCAHRETILAALRGRP